MEKAEEGDSNETGNDLMDLKEGLQLKKREMIRAFQTVVIQPKPKTMFPKHNSQVMTHTLSEGDGSLPHGLKVQDTYMDMTDGGNTAAVMIQNCTAHSITIRKGTPVTQVEAAKLVPNPPDMPGHQRDHGQGVRDCCAKDDKGGKDEAAL